MMMTDPSSTSSFDLTPGGSRRVIRWVLAGAGLAVLGVAAVVIFKLATAEPGGEACDHFDALVAKAENRDDLVRYIERSVESQVVAVGMTRTERVQVKGCRQALAALDKAMTHGQFTRVTDCILGAKTARTAARCF